MSSIPVNYITKVNKDISVNQVGYGPMLNKLAISKAQIEGAFYVVNEDNNNVVLESFASEAIFDTTNKINVYHLDFSNVKEEGRYYIQTNIGRSYSFDVKNDYLREVHNAMIKALYYQRCGCALEEVHAGVYKHGVCHNIPAYLFTDPSVRVEDITGGWHDAGDYGRYITPANQTVFNMMYAYELFSDGTSDNLNIPETGNGTPDILNECKYELDWMLKMQADCGGVYHKVATVNFAGNDMPDTDPFDTEVLAPISMTATAGFSAAMACAARVYKKLNTEFSGKCLAASRKAFDYAITNYKDAKPFENPKGMNSGGYGDDCWLDEIYWAAAELFRTTGEKVYEGHVEDFFKEKFSKTSFGAYHQGGHGSLAYCLCENAKPELREKVLAEIVSAADRYLKIANENGYKIALNGGNETEENEYYWGSNAVLTNNLANIISSAVLTKTNKYDQVIRDSISYILGRNYLSQSYVTGFGSNKPKNPHHRPSMFDGVEEAVPGFVIGGPNDRKWQRPQEVKGVKQSEGIDWDNMPPAGCFIDWEWNWTTNEVTIYWNSSCFYVTAYLRTIDEN